MLIDRAAYIGLVCESRACQLSSVTFESLDAFERRRGAPARRVRLPRDVETRRRC